MGNSSPQKLSSEKNAKKACKIGYSLCFNTKECGVHPDDSKKWFLYALELVSKANSAKEKYEDAMVKIYANSFLGWLSVPTTKPDGLLTPVGSLQQLLYQLKYWLQAGIDANAHGLNEYFTQFGLYGQHPWPDKQVQLWLAMLARLQHNQELLLGYWIENCRPALVEYVVPEEVRHDEDRLLKLHYHPLKQKSSYNLRTCSKCKWEGFHESFHCEKCRLDVCMACYYSIDHKSVVYRTLYELATVLYSSSNEKKVYSSSNEKVHSSNNEKNARDNIKTLINYCLLEKIFSPDNKVFATHRVLSYIGSPYDRNSFAFYRIAQDIVKHANLPNESVDNNDVCNIASIDGLDLDRDHYSTMFSIPMYHDFEIGDAC